MRPIINTEKHITQFPIATVTAGAIANNLVVVATQTVTGTTSSHVRIGAVIKAVYCELWLIGIADSTSTFVLTVEKLVAGAVAMTAAEAVSLYTYDNKKNIFYTSQGILPQDTANPIPVIREWVKIPKGKQRFGLGDRLNINVHAVSSNTLTCGVAIFKAQT